MTLSCKGPINTVIQFFLLEGNCIEFVAMVLRRAFLHFERGYYMLSGSVLA